MKELKCTLVQEVGKCENCGYSKFPQILEVAHIRHGYELEKLRLSNVKLLCRNCHFEFDRGLISIRGEWSDSKLSTNYAEKAKIHPNEGYWEKDPKTGKSKYVCR